MWLAASFNRNDNNKDSKDDDWTISPPNKVPTFNKNLTINDGVLVDFIKTQNNCSLEEANKIVEDFVAEMEAKIENKDIVEFPKVGRIYKDYNKKI